MKIKPVLFILLMFKLSAYSQWACMVIYVKVRSAVFNSLGALGGDNSASYTSQVQLCGERRRQCDLPNLSTRHKH